MRLPKNGSTARYAHAHHDKMSRELSREKSSVKWLTGKVRCQGNTITVQLVKLLISTDVTMPPYLATSVKTAGIIILDFLSVTILGDRE